SFYHPLTYLQPRCRRQIARYTCPQCNIPYCSSTCFKSPAHANCSEPFYKKQIESDARSGSTSNAKPTLTQTQERLKMMEILRRFEEEDNENLGQFGEDDGDGDEEEDDEDDIAKRLAGIDIASASPNLLWSLLSDSERAQFVKAIQDPSSALSQELLLSDELRREVTYRPWWEAGLRIDDTDDIRSSPPPPHLPKPISIPLTMIQPRPFPNGPPLIYNLCAICFAYAYTTRRLGKSPLAPSHIEDIEDIEESKRILAQLVPFLIKRKSAVLYSTVSDAIDDVWSKSTVSTSTSTSNSHSETSTFSVLMQDTATLLRPQPIVVAVDVPSHPHRNAVYVLSDLHRLFSIADRTDPNHNPHSHSHITHKLLFYTAHVLSTPSVILRSVSDE
ncbi:hypothetical protein F5878DRAFT_518329, partial [Lentinula raphanica]